MATKTVLFADNHVEFLDTRAAYLEMAGYRVIKATSADEAERVLRDEWVHLAILDKRLTDNDDPLDMSGLLVAKNPLLRSIPKIILTAYPELRSTVEALRPIHGQLPAAVDYCSKEDGPDALLAAMQRAMDEHVRLNWDLEIAWVAIDQFSLIRRIDNQAEDSRVLNRAEEIEDLFRRLFPTQYSVRIERVLWQREQRVALLFIAFEQGKAAESMMVVCGQASTMREETQRYQASAPKAPSNTATVLHMNAETTHFAANAYMLAEADLENARSLLDLHRVGPERSFTNALTVLFQKTLAAWHQEKRVTSDRKTLADIYRERLTMPKWELLPESFVERLQEIIRVLPTLGFDITYDADTLFYQIGRQSCSYPVPVALLSRPPIARSPVLLINTSGAISGENILTDGEEHVWLTDFADAGMAPLTWNFVALEATIRFNWIEATKLQQIHDVEQRLVNLSSFSRLDTQDIDAPMARALRAILKIRQFAADSIDKEPLSYQLGIFFHAANMIIRSDIGIHHTQRELARLAHAVLAVAMIGKQFEWPHVIEATTGVPEQARGLRIDEDNREVWVEGHAIVLTRMEFELLRYLHERVNQLCKRGYLFESLFHAPYTSSSDQNSVLNTHIGRLRKKLEPDPIHPRYIVTVQGVGYKLVLQPDEVSE